MGPHNNIFSSILFVIPGIIFTNIFRWMLLRIYRFKRFNTPENRNLWLKGIAKSKPYLVCQKTLSAYSYASSLVEINDLSTNVVTTNFSVASNTLRSGQNTYGRRKLSRNSHSVSSTSKSEGGEMQLHLFKRSIDSITTYPKR